MEWISVKDRLPEDSQCVLYYAGYTDVAVYDSLGYFETFGGYTPKTELVTHWQPLPEPPK